MTALNDLNSSHLGKHVTVHCPCEVHEGTLEYIGHGDDGETELRLGGRVSFTGSEPSTTRIEVQG